MRWGAHDEKEILMPHFCLDEVKAIVAAIGAVTMIPLCTRWVWHDIKCRVQRKSR